MLHGRGFEKARWREKEARLSNYAWKKRKHNNTRVGYWGDCARLKKRKDINTRAIATLFREKTRGNDVPGMLSDQHINTMYSNEFEYSAQQILPQHLASSGILNPHYDI